MQRSDNQSLGRPCDQGILTGSSLKRLKQLNPSSSDILPAKGGSAGRYGLRDLKPYWAAFLLRWPLIVGGLILALPTMYGVASENWSTEQGAHGPIVLATGLWLFARRWPEIRDRRTPGRAAWALLAF